MNCPWEKCEGEQRQTEEESDLALTPHLDEVVALPAAPNTFARGLEGNGHEIGLSLVNRGPLGCGWHPC